ncbi:DNA polymerase I [Calditerricola satsumensis]|uniref:DNA polymerase I n=1 Tax=Calditerricola satsumensis TaxID=373054 RepID=A0A8J3F9C0_9BACI|nr:DNA polymerase I [Calditerricola satsumensis]GGJ93118.1 DNA polymerase [Calditerricola satsumensis]
MEKLVLIDGNSIANRAFYALPPLTLASGQHTHAVYGFTTMLLKVLEEERPTHLLVAFDAGKVTFRHARFEAYKGKRHKTPNELSEQFPLIKDVLDAFGIRYHEQEGFEADDIIGTVSAWAEARGLATRIVTGDKDLLQLVSPYVTVALTRKGISETERYDEAAIRQKYGLTPAQLVDLKGLMGDASDNIPGVPGVGEKTALKLLAQFGSVEEVVRRVDEISGPKLREAIAAHREQALVSKELAVIRRDVPLPFELEDLRYDGFALEPVREVFRRLEFKSLLDRLPHVPGARAPGETSTGAEEGDAAPTPLDVAVAGTAEDAALERLLAAPAAVVVELDGDNYHEAALLGIGVYSDAGALFVPAARVEEWEALRAFLADPTREKWVYDGKRGEVALRWRGLSLEGIAFDVLIASYLLNPTESRHALSDLAPRAGLSLAPDEEVYGKGAKRRALAAGELAAHVCRKAQAIYRLKPLLEREVEEAEMNGLFYDLELPLSRILAAMEHAGFRVDTARLKEMGEEFERRLEELTAEIYRLAGTPFNINSPKQLGEILFDKLGLPPLKKTKTGYSTSADVLEKLQDAHEIVPKILYYRTLGKLKSTYVDGLLKEVNPRTGKIHTIFNQALTATGRLSSAEPNLQNIPIRLEEGRRIRQAFVPSEPGWKLLAADYSQIELRVLAHLSQDEALVDAFHRDMDIHTRTAMDVFGVPEDAVTPLMRRQAKAVNFGIIYGISDYGLSQNLGIPRKEAAAFIERYFDVFRGVKRYMEDVVEEARRKGYVTTLLGRRRFLPDIHSPNYNLRSFAERTARNTPIQGTAADIIKLAMVNLARRLKEEGLRSRLILQVHDELVFEVPEDELAVMRELVPAVMERAVRLSVPLKVDVHVGDTWYDAK